MPIVQALRYGQVTIPKKLRDSLHIKEGDVLEAELHEGTIVLTPKILMNKEQAWEKVMQVIDTVHAKTDHIPPEEAEQDAVALVNAARRNSHAARCA